MDIRHYARFRLFIIDLRYSLETQNPRSASPWGFNSPSRHHFMRHILLSFKCSPRSIMLLVLGPSGWVPHQGSNSGTVRIHFRFKILHSFAADSTSDDSLHLRQISECAADLLSSSRAVSADLNAHRPRLTTRALFMFSEPGILEKRFGEFCAPRNPPVSGCEPG